MTGRFDRWLPYAALALFFVATVFLRPLQPVDETRYMSVAWDMWLHKEFFVLTLNSGVYTQKPPLLFWLINAVWALLGVGRAQAMLVVFLASCAVMHLARLLAAALFPGREDIAGRVPWLVAGSVGFLFFATFVEFDVLLAVFVLAAAVFLLRFAEGRGLRFAALGGLMIGFGVLAKGPVILVHILWPIALYPLWRDPGRHLASRTFLLGLPLALACALAAVALWLVPAVMEAGPDFAYDLVWRQAAGRIAGNLEVAHARPLLWYLPMLPLLFLPWIALPWLWRGQSLVRLKDWVRGQLAPDERRPLRLLALWLAGAVLAFSLISGKQAKYLVPEIPLAAIGMAPFLAAMPAPLLRRALALTVAGFIVGQVAFALFFYPRRDLSGLAAEIARRPDAQWAFAGGYQGEVNFLARAEKPFVELDEDDAAAWLAAAPNRFVVDLRDDTEGLGTPVYTHPYHRKDLRVFAHSGR